MWKDKLNINLDDVNKHHAGLRQENNIYLLDNSISIKTGYVNRSRLHLKQKGSTILILYAVFVKQTTYFQPPEKSTQKITSSKEFNSFAGKLSFIWVC